MNTEKKPDRRVQRTKKAIRAAFAELFANKSAEEITVTDIARKANINRKTFYNYYPGVHSIAQEIEDEIFASLDESLKGVDLYAEPETTVARLSGVICADMEFCRSIFTSRNNAAYTIRLLSVITDRIKAPISKETDIAGRELDIMTEYTLAGLLQVYRRRIAAGDDIMDEGFCRTLAGIMLYGVNAFIRRG